MRLFKGIANNFKRSTLALMTLGMISSTSFTSCSPELWAGVAMGLAGVPSYSVGNTGYASTSSASYYSTGTLSSSTSGHTCRRCNGSGQCQTCGGSGKVYDYNSYSIITKEKTIRNCGVCSGRGRCGVCDGKGSF